MPQAYDKFARHYDAGIARLERWFLAAMRGETLGMLQQRARVLEVGAGTGANFKYYPECSHAVAGDVSIAMLNIAQAKTKVIDIVQADAESLPFDDGYFDAAFATLVFCSIADPAAAIAEIIRVVRPGGRVVLLEHVRPPRLLGHIFDVLSVLTVALIDDHFNRRTAELASAAGLNVLEVRHKVWGIIDLIICDTPKQE